MITRPLEARIRRILVLVFVVSFACVAFVSGFNEYRQTRDDYIEQMKGQEHIAQQIITDFILAYDGHLKEIVRQCPQGNASEMQRYFKQAIHFHDAGDLFYLLDDKFRIFFISAPYDAYAGMNLSHNVFFKSSEKISRVHQSLFSNKSIISMQYPMPCGMTLVVERDIQNVIRAMSFFEKGKIFPSQIMFVLTTEGTVAYHPDVNLVKSRHNLAIEMKKWSPPAAGELFTYELHNEKYFALKEDFSMPKGWTIYFAVPDHQVFAPIKKAVIQQFFMNLFFFAFIYAVLQLLLNRYFSKPVTAIVAALERYDFSKDGRVIAHEMDFGVEELAAIIEAVNAMSAELGLSHAQLKQSEEQIRLLLNSTAESIYGLDTSGRCTFCNKAFLQKMGYVSERQLLGKDMHSLIHHSRADSTPYSVEQCVAHKGFLEAKKTHIDNEVFWRADGTSIPVEYWSYPIVHHDKVVGAVVTFIDITKRKKAEEKLAAEKEQLAVTLRSIGDAVITTDIGGRVVLLNKVAEQLTGWSQQEARGRPLPDVFHIIDEQSHLPRENPVDQVVQTGTIMEMQNHTALICRDGAVHPISDSAAPIRDRDSQIVGVVIVFRDVTQHNIMQEEALKAKKLESIGVLAGGIAHDFNNILTAILGNISLTRDMVDDEMVNSLLGSAEKASLRAKGLTHQLLTFAKGGEPVTETASVAEVIRESADFVLHGSNVACTFTIAKDLWLVKIDKAQISQVVQNIVINAKNAMAEGGTVEIHCENFLCRPDDPLPLEPGKYVRISIKDTGTGIAHEYLDKIFDPYFTTSKTMGQGLGLAVTRSIIAKHDGHISVQSNVGQGTTFTIYLPASGDHFEERKIPAAKVENIAGRILLMDDEEVVRMVTQRMLTRQGFDVETSLHGQEMIDIYKKEAEAGRPFDMVILDLTIPGGMGGKEALQKLLEYDPEARAIVASGYSNDPVMASYERHGFKGAVIKPFQIIELMEEIRRIMSEP